VSTPGIASESRQDCASATWRDRLGLPSALILWAGTALLVGLLLLLLPARLPLHWVVPATSAASIVCLALVTWLAALDVLLRADSASLPAVTIGTALGATWLARLLSIPEVRPAFQGAAGDHAASWLYLYLNLATPSLLALAALYVPRPLGDGARAVRIAVAVGLAVALVLVAYAGLLGVSPWDPMRGDAFGPSIHLAGVLGLVPVAAAVILLLSGHRGDERVLRGMVPALGLSAVNSVLLIWVDARYTPIWHAVQVLPTAIAICLLYGQLNLYARAVESEVRAGARLQDSFVTAEALAASLRPDVVIDELLEQGELTVEADRTVLFAVHGDSVVVQGSRSRDTAPLAVGDTFPLATMPCLEEAVATRHIKVLGSPDPAGLDRALAQRLANSRHALAVPLVLSGELVGVLAFIRVRDVPFCVEDLAAVGTIATVAGLALRNARRFASVEEVSQAKTLFLNMAAHELRTPLSVVRGYASMLHDGTLGELPDQASDAVTALQSKSDELTHLVEGLLMCSRLEAGRSRPRWQELDLRMVVTAAVARLRPSVELRGAWVDVDLPAGPLPLRADPDYLGRILDNLLVNAMTYSKGRPWLRVSGTCRPDGRVGVAVEDHGVGLRPEDQEHIFERFERVEHAQLGFPVGTGLGLYLSRRLAEDMGGSVRLDWSSPGHGSRFVLELPLLQRVPARLART